jgi:4-hydroxy-2-oxoheptanedioate aldolase
MMHSPPSWADALGRANPSLGITITVGDPTVAEAIAVSGADWLVVDHEHSTCTPRDLEPIAMAGQLAGIPVLARVAENRLDDVQHALDAGAAGVIVPRVTTADSAAAALAHARYPPEGRRGFGPRRANRYGRDTSYVTRANRDVALIIQVEHTEAVARLDDILTVPFDGIYVGPNDLAASMGLLGQPGHPDVVQTIVAVIDAGSAAGIPVGVGIGDAAGARQYIEHGARFLGIGGDIWLLAGAVGSLVADYRRVATEALSSATEVSGTDRKHGPDAALRAS